MAKFDPKKADLNNDGKLSDYEKNRGEATAAAMQMSVADNVFKMQMNNPDKTKDTPGTFNAKDQKVMAMSTMFQTEDPDGTRPKVQPITSNVQIAGAEPITSKQVFTGYSGGGVFQNQEQKDFYDNQIAQRTAAGMTPEQAVQDYRNTFKIGEKQFKTELSGGKTKYTDDMGFSNLSASFDSVVKPDKNKTGGGSSKTSGKSGMVDTFSALDTRQGKRKVAIEERMQLQDARGEKKQQRKTDRLGRKEEKQAFKESKKQARQDRRQARKDLNQAKRNNRKDASATRDAFMANPNISGSDGYRLKSGMVSSDRSVADAKARLEAAKSNLKSTRKNRPDTAAEQRRQRKKTFQDTRNRLASERAAENRKIVEQGKAQRSAGKNPLTTKEFDPSSPIFMAKRKMSFRK